MAYNNWKLMDRIAVAVRTGPGNYGFTGYIVGDGDKDALEKAKDWARTKEWDQEKREYTDTHEPKVHIFDNKGFAATILDSAGGSSQGGRLSFWRCEVEKDGIKFTIGVNDAILADLIKNSEIKNGVIKEELMFARKGGQPGLIHEGMQAYVDATRDMAHKAEMKKAKKTSKWEIGGIYQTITQTDMCLGEVWDTMEEVNDQEYRGWYPRTKLVKRDKPVKVLTWDYISKYSNDGEAPTDFTKYLEEKLDSNYHHFYAGKPPARTKTAQLEVKESDLKLLDKLINKSNDGRYKRVK